MIEAYIVPANGDNRYLILLTAIAPSHLTVLRIRSRIEKLSIPELFLTNAITSKEREVIETYRNCQGPMNHKELIRPPPNAAPVFVIKRKVWIQDVRYSGRIN
ncbi:MAG: hypothetical protein QNJ58_11130 [Desulfobacterales bacterium]|nr:hypothetical protein [Desulfobacterales bacterium]